MKLAVIGGSGLLGSTTAFCAGSEGLFDEIFLIGRREHVTKSHVMDMDQAMRALSRTRIRMGDYDCLQDCDVLLMTASPPERQVDNRNEYLQANLELVRGIIAQIGKHCTDKVLINATNPIDIFSYIYYRTLGWPRQRFLGFGYNDTLRLKWALADETGLDYADFEAYTLGEHGDLQVPVFEQIKHKGVPFLLQESQKAEISHKISRYFREFQALNAGRTSGWTSAVGLTTLLRAIVQEQDAYFPCSAVLDGEYGIRGMSLGVPVRLGRKGIRNVLELDLLPQTSALLHAAAHELQARCTIFGI